jgi:hypothetical protein
MEEGSQEVSAMFEWFNIQKQTLTPSYSNVINCYPDIQSIYSEVHQWGEQLGGLLKWIRNS